MPNDSSLDFSVGQATHTGLVRRKNEDSFGWFSLDGGELFIVADGMGGYAGGAEASKQTVLSFKGYFESHYAPRQAQHNAQHQGSPEKILQDALLFADARVQEIGRKNPALSNCGSTIVAFFVSGKTGYFIHAGDSRLYVFRNGQLRQVSRDHSAVQDMLTAGVITGREAAKAPRNVITQSVGGNIDASRCTVERFEIVPGSSYLLCSDGLWGTVPADRIRHILSQPVPASSKANLMINAAIDAGGPDNITVQVIEFAGTGLSGAGMNRPGGFERQAQQAGEQKGLRRLFYVTVSLLVLISVLICGYFGYSYFAEPSPETKAPCADSKEKPKAGQDDAAGSESREDAVMPEDKPAVKSDEPDEKTADKSDEKPDVKTDEKPEAVHEPVPQSPALVVPAVVPETKKQPGQAAAQARPEAAKKQQPKQSAPKAGSEAAKKQQSKPSAARAGSDTAKKQQPKPSAAKAAPEAAKKTQQKPAAHKDRPAQEKEKKQQ